jgi:exodeoxyribonuclease V gamma subunit
MRAMSLDELLTPGFMVVHGNHPETLRDLVRDWMRRHPLAPLEDECILVQSNGVAQWLRLALAQDSAQGGHGIAAALQVQLPMRFVWQAYRAVLGADAVPRTSALDAEPLTWRLMRLLPALLQDPAFAPLQRFLAQDDDLRKRHQLAERLADLLDQYQVYRADWLAAWAKGADMVTRGRQGLQPVPAEQAWQPRLWRALQEDVGAAAAAGSRAAVHRRFMAAVQGWQGPWPSRLPRRVIVFGLSALPQQTLEALAALGRWCQVLMCVHNPCRHDWSHTVPDRDLLRAAQHRQRRRAGSEGPVHEDQLHLHAHPLLAAWGRQGRDFIRLLDAHDDLQSYAGRFAALGQRVDCFDENTDPAHPKLLHQLQDDVLDLRPLAETRQQPRVLNPQTDRSLRFHVTHGPLREVEVLHDQLLSAFAADPTLRPRDVLVMVPDIQAYAPLVQAVFGLHRAAAPSAAPAACADGGPGAATSPASAAQDWRRRIPFSVVDRGARHQDALSVALEALLGLPQSRLGASEVQDLLQVPALRRRFGIDEAQLPQLQAWIAQAGIRWGLGAEHRASLGLPDGLDHNTWALGLQRLLLGYAVGQGSAWQGLEPVDEVGGLDAALLGPLARLVQALQRHWRALAASARPAEWAERLRALLQDFFLPDGGAEALLLLRLESTLLGWLQTCEAAALDEPMPLSVVREHWLAQMDQGGLGSPFFGGGVTFATLMPMRAIPFRFVALLGMNDGDYPRSRVAPDFDLMAHDPRPGDRSRREDDRYLFLEALLSARHQLHISWAGRSLHDNDERPPSVLVAQLRDHLAAVWRLTGDGLPGAEAGQALLQALTVHHPLPPFSPAYFAEGGPPELFSHAQEWRQALMAQEQARGQVQEMGQGNGQGSGQGNRQEHWQEQVPPALTPMVRDTPLTLRELAAFLRDPIGQFFELRLGVHLARDSEDMPDHEPFELNGLENWQLQDELIHAQRAALEAGEPPEAALQHGLDRLERSGALPARAFGRQARQALAEPMTELFTEWAQQLQTWPEEAPDEPVAWPLAQGGDALVDPAAPTSVNTGPQPGATPAGTPAVADQLTQLRRNAQGQRCRLVLESSGVIKDKHYRTDKLAAAWVAHLAGHLGGEPLTTVVVSKAGTATLPPLSPLQAEQAWQDLLGAWQEGMTRPLPFVQRCSDAWWVALLKEGANSAKPRDAARKAYEHHDPEHGASAERELNACAARAFPDFDALWAGGEFAHWARTLLGPLRQALPAAASRKASGPGAATEGTP